MSLSPLRPATADDAEAIASLFHEVYGDTRPVDAEEVRSWLRNPQISADDVRVLEQGGEIVGYGDLFVDGDVQLDAAAPGHWAAFLAWAEQRTREAGLTRTRVYFAEGHDLEGVVAARGYRYWRSSFEMHIDLPAGPAVVSLPDGLELRPYREEDVATVSFTMNEAFSEDPFWHLVTPEVFRSVYLGERGTDTALWLFAWDGDRLAGFALPSPRRGSDETLGWVRVLGVLKPWRRQGLGEALLRTAFGVLYDRGLRQVGLGVDAENPTGALRLYERAGMRPLTRNDNWALDL